MHRQLLKPMQKKLLNNSPRKRKRRQRRKQLQLIRLPKKPRNRSVCARDRKRRPRRTNLSRIRMTRAQTNSVICHLTDRNATRNFVLKRYTLLSRISNRPWLIKKSESDAVFITLEQKVKCASLLAESHTRLFNVFSLSEKLSAKVWLLLQVRSQKSLS